MRVLVIVILVALAGCSAQKKDGRFSPTDKSFRVYFPGEPHQDRSSSVSGPITTETRRFTYRTSTGAFVLDYLEMSPTPPESIRAEALEAALAGTLSKNPGRVISRQSSMIKGRPTMVVQIACENGSVIDGRLMYIPPRVYQLLVVHPPDVRPAEMDRFFDSFAVAD